MNHPGKEPVSFLCCRWRISIPKEVEWLLYPKLGRTVWTPPLTWLLEMRQVHYCRKFMHKQQPRTLPQTAKSMYLRPHILQFQSGVCFFSCVSFIPGSMVKFTTIKYPPSAYGVLIILTPIHHPKKKSQWLDVYKTPFFVAMLNGNTQGVALLRHWPMLKRKHWISWFFCEGLKRNIIFHIHLHVWIPGIRLYWLHHLKFWGTSQVASCPQIKSG